MNTSSSKTAIGINLGSPNGIPTKPINTIEIRIPNTKDSDFINDTVRFKIHNNIMYFNSPLIIIRQGFKFKY